MKRWMQKLIDQFEFDGTQASEEQIEQMSQISEDRATLLYFLDTYNKHLIEIESKPVRKVREVLDTFAKQLVDPSQDINRVLFRLRQFFSSYRIDEYSYVQKTFDDFRAIIWDLVDQLAEDIVQEQNESDEMQESLEELKEAVESNSIDVLKNQSRQFIDSYMEFQTRKDERRTERMGMIKKNLDSVKKKLTEANQNMRRDHLTSAFNRKSFDEHVKEQVSMQKVTGGSVSMIMLDIDHFKKINDNYGHAIGDFVLVECVKLLNKLFSRDNDFVARIGGEEFAIILPNHKIDHVVPKAENALKTIASEVFVQDDAEIRFTVSMGISELAPNEDGESWMKRADDALYESKNSGRNKFTVAKPPAQLKVA